MISIQRTDSDNADFQMLVRLLDADLAIRDGDDHAFYAQYNKTNHIKHCLVARISDQPVGCGALRAFDEKTMEVKRMYALPEFRRQGIASAVLSELELWARDLGYARVVLETGKNQPEAISLYQKWGYQLIPNYGPYVGVENSVCMQKVTAKNFLMPEISK